MNPVILSANNAGVLQPINVLLVNLPKCFQMEDVLLQLNVHSLVKCKMGNALSKIVVNVKTTVHLVVHPLLSAIHVRLATFMKATLGNAFNRPKIKMETLSKGELRAKNFLMY